MIAGNLGKTRTTQVLMVNPLFSVHQFIQALIQQQFSHFLSMKSMQLLLQKVANFLHLGTMEGDELLGHFHTKITKSSQNLR